MDEPMNCHDALTLLSTYHDGELTSRTRESLEAHLADCPICQQELSDLRRLSNLWDQPVETLDETTCLAQFRRLQAELDCGDAGRPATPSVTSANHDVAWHPSLGGFLSNRRGSLLVVVASLLVALSAGTWVVLPSASTNDSAGSFNLDQFVADLQSDPDHAEDKLLALYRGRLVSEQRVESLLKHRPRFLDHRPNGFKLVALNLLEMRGSLCPQAIFQTANGSLIYVFEHEAGRPLHTKNYPLIHANCCHRGVLLAEVGHSLLVDWQSEDVAFTAVGLKSMEDVIQLVQAIEG
jgi:hypothetical protein